MRPVPAALCAAIAIASCGAFAAPLTLDEAQRRAIERSRQLGAHDLAATASLEMAKAAGELADPVLKIGVDNVPIEGGDRFSLTRDFMTMRRIGLMQEFTSADKRALKRERFEWEAQRALADKSVTLAGIRRDTALAWLDRFYLGEMRAVAQQQVKATEGEVESADSAYRAARGTQAKVFAARSGLALARDRLDEIERRWRAARIALSRWTGDEAPEGLAALPAMETLRLGEGVLESHLERHPEILAVEGQARAADAEARLASAARRPDWTWEAAYQQRGPAYSNMFSIGVSVPLPWDPANRQDRQAASKRATVEQLRATRDEMLRAHVAEVAAMIEEWRAGRKRLVRYRDEVLPFTRERTVATLAAYSGGRVTLNDVLAARRGEFDLRLQQLELEREVARSWARLAFLLPDDSMAGMHPELVSPGRAP